MTKNNKRRIVYILAAVLCVALFAVCMYFVLNPTAVPKVSGGGFDTSADFVKFMDVGQADSALIYSNGYSAVIDAGLPDSVAEIYKDLSDCFVEEIDVALISHLHSDHLGGLYKLAENCTVKNLIMPEILTSSIAAASDSKNLITGYGASFYNAVPGINFKIGEFEITVLGYLDDRKNENNRSLFTIAEIDGVKFLFTGDAEAKAEKYILEQQINIDCDVLKVSHHGSDTGTSKEFLNMSSPRYAVISVGEDNMYNHPHSTTLELLKQSDTEIYRTDTQGDVTFNVNKGRVTVQTEK